MLARFVSRLLTAGALGATIAAIGCATSGAKLKAPEVLASPYDTSAGDVLWAVIPLRNESGTTLFDPSDVSDKVVAAAAQVRGVRVLPLNRTIAAMRSLKMASVSSPADARRLAQEMGVDGIVLGSITHFDPYDPPKLGLSLALYTRPGAMDRRGEAHLDPRTLSVQPTEYNPFPGSSFTDAPASVVSEYLDGKNHQVLMDLKRFAQGRHDEETALGWRRYLASMDLFSEFAAWRAVGGLLGHEWLRLARATPETVGR